MNPAEAAPTFCVQTLGCKANQYDSHALRADLRRRGLVEADFGPGRDAYVVNTCSVTQMAGQKSRKMIAGLVRRNPGAIVVVTGCYAETDLDRLIRMKGVHRVFGNAQKGAIARFVAEAVGRPPAPLGNETEAHEACGESTLPAKVTDFGNQTRPFVKIQDGCDLHCTYCIIPSTRGGLSSREPDLVVEECAALAEAGHREIVLTGIHLGGYGHDRGRPGMLIDLLERLVEVPGLVRLRLSSIEVQEVSEVLIEMVASTPCLCPHFHIPLQSGSDRVLRRMGRRYDSEIYLETLRAIRRRMDGVALNTDVIVGFPGESDEDFARTLEVCREAGFSRMHIFPYSDRPGTPSVRLPGKVDPGTIARRKRALADLATEMGTAFHRSRRGARLRVLAESRRTAGTDEVRGYSDEYIEVRFDGPGAEAGELYEVDIREARPDHAIGDLVGPAA